MEAPDWYHYSEKEPIFMYQIQTLARTSEQAYVPFTFFHMDHCAISFFLQRSIHERVEEKIVALKLQIVSFLHRNLILCES